MKLISMAATSALRRIRLSQHFVGANRATTFGSGFTSFSWGGDDSESSECPRPKAVAWRKELANTVHLIGNIVNPVQTKRTEEGKAFAWTNLEVKYYSRSPHITWYQLNFLEDLAGTAAEHLNTRDRVYVSGCLEFENVAGEDNDTHILSKVWVNKLNFVELPTTLMNASLQNQVFEVKSSASLQSKVSEVNRSTSFQSKVSEVSSSAPLQSQDSEDQNIKLSVSGEKTAINTTSTETLWRAFFDDPTKWWDNRNNKKNPKAPDFKHKDTGEALWIENRKNPSWVKSELDILN